MVTSLADFLKIDIARFDATGALDPILGVDTRLFIDPALLRVTDVPELLGSYEKIVSYFNDVLKVVRGIGTEGDRLWRAADKMMSFPEVKGLCIGYSKKGTDGSGMGPALRRRLLKTITSIVRAGIADPAIFELVGIFEDDVGPDRISDMVARIIADELIAFTHRVCKECSIPMQRAFIRGVPGAVELPYDPNTGKPIILVPKGVLRDLPIADSYGDIYWIAEHNQALRNQLNSLIGFSWGKITTSEKKEILRNWFVSEPDSLRSVIDAYRGAEPIEYDFDSDPAGEVVWYRRSKEIAAAAPLELALSVKAGIDEVDGVVQKICEHFRRLVEDNQLAKLLYDNQGKRKHESAAQLLFFGVASAYCEANDLDLSPESNAGRGPVDFKMSRGFDAKVLVEVKLTSNNQLLHGFESQLPIYQAAEGSRRGTYLVIDNGGASDSRIAKFWEVVRATKQACPKVIWVDAKVRPSASKADD